MRETLLVRRGGTGRVIGLDLIALIELARIRGIDVGVAAALLPAIEAGMLSALAKRADRDEEGAD